MTGGLLVVATSLAPDHAVRRRTRGTVPIVLATMLLGVGMAHVMAPATDSIMGSLPRAKAGVGSAMNDTTRQVGGALGVAILGSVLSSRYGTRIAELLPGLPPKVVEAASNNVGEAIGFSNSPAGRPFAAQIARRARTTRSSTGSTPRSCSPPG